MMMIARCVVHGMEDVIVTNISSVTLTQQSSFFLWYGNSLHDEGFFASFALHHHHFTSTSRAHSTKSNGWRRLLRKIVECAMEFE